jgi:hypothetical protein
MAKFLFLSALFLPSLVVTVAATSAISRSCTLTSVALDRLDRVRITSESSCDEDGLLDRNVDSLMRSRATSTYTRRNRSSSSSISSSAIQQLSTSTNKSHSNDGSAAFLNIRGGAAGASPSLPPSSLSDSWKSLLSFSQGVFQDHVQPALADPEHKILKPVKAFLVQQAAAATAERRQRYQKHSNNAEDDEILSPTSTAASASQPARILRLVIVALVLAQALETTGILDANANKKFFDAWEKHAQPLWEDLTYNVQDWTSSVRHWWKEARRTGIGILSATTWSDPVSLSNSWKTQVSPKYQTAVGLGIGMVFSPFLWTAGEGLLRTGVGAYIVAEVVHQLLESQFWKEQQEEDNWFTSPAFGGTKQDVAEWELDIATTVRDLLETWRQTVRDTVQSVRQARAGDNSSSYRYSYSRQQRRRDTGGLFPPHMRSGVIVGTVIGVLAGA